MANQRDVARLAGVSSATVSRYLHDPNQIKPKFRDKIQSAIDQLSYQIDYSAQTLKTGRYQHVGILSPSIGPFHWEFFSTLQDGLNQAGYSTSPLFTRDVNTLEHSHSNRMPPFLRRRHLDGAIYFPLQTPEDDSLISWLADWGHPVVMLDRHDALAAPHPRMRQLSFDNYWGGREAARLLLEAGHRDFLFIWGARDNSSARERHRGFAERLAEAGIELGPDRQIDGCYQAPVAYREMKQRLPGLPPFSAVFASNDPSAIGVLKALNEAGRRCPKDFSLIGFDDNADFAAFLDPPLTTFRQPIHDLGTMAARILVDLIEGREPAEHPAMLKPRLVERESVGPVPG